jgi:isoaspartyl peptidase/L-asparaginase-like protein (Ntn-hydrolase superfamily)
MKTLAVIMALGIAVSSASVHAGGKWMLAAVHNLDDDPLFNAGKGAVALDHSGHLAAATRTGGLTGKHWGRVGDSPNLGFAPQPVHQLTCRARAPGRPRGSPCPGFALRG